LSDVLPFGRQWYAEGDHKCNRLREVPGRIVKGRNMQFALSISARTRLADGLVVVDCQFGLEEGKMKGSTKPQRMDEPFYS